MPFTGIHDHTLDAKNRLTVPARTRAELTGAVSVVKSPDGCLQLWPASAYEAHAERELEGVSPFTERGRVLRRYFYGSSVATELDKAGRVMLPGHALAHASITREVVVVGAGDWLELWDRDAYAATDADLIGRAADLFENLGHPA